jgi:quercetin dioxygenase-like cupin family protein
MVKNIRAFSESFPSAQAVNLPEMIQYGEDAVVSRTLAKGESGTLTLFAFDVGQELSEHTAPFDAYIQVVDGDGMFTVGGEPVPASAGQSVLMPAGIPHAVLAVTRMKMILFMLRK